MNVLYQIVDHCDLNCVGCDHGSPIAKPWFVNENQFENDLCLLTTKVCVDEVIIYGGEPLLHPHLPKLLMIARATCPNALLYIKTNGLRFKQWMNCNAFRVALRVTGTRLEITEYPPTLGLLSSINADYPGLADRAAVVDGEQCGVKSFMFRVKLHKPGDVWPSAETAYANCYLRCQTVGLRVRAGKAYPCPLAMCAPIAFSNILQDIPDVGLNIVNATTDELLTLCHKPCELCAWCGGVDHGIQWTQSTKDKNEWVVKGV